MKGKLAVNAGVVNYLEFAIKIKTADENICSYCVRHRFPFKNKTFESCMSVYMWMCVAKSKILFVFGKWDITARLFRWIYACRRCQPNSMHNMHYTLHFMLINNLVKAFSWHCIAKFTACVAILILIIYIYIIIQI